MKRFNITVNGNAYDVTVVETGGGTSAPSVPAAVPAPAPASKPSAPAAGGSVKITAPMPGTILDVKVNVGDSVTKGQVVAVLEAMKMENDIVAPQDGKIAGIAVKKGDSVNSNDTLITMD